MNLCDFFGTSPLYGPLSRCEYSFLSEFLKSGNSTVNNVVIVNLGDWGCATKKLVAKNEDPLMNGDLRRGNRAYMPPEIVNAGRGKILDYKRSIIISYVAF